MTPSHTAPTQNARPPTGQARAQNLLASTQIMTRDFASAKPGGSDPIAAS